MTVRVLTLTGGTTLAVFLVVALVSAAPVAAQDAGQPAAQEASEPVLYERLGGERAVRAASTELVRLLQADPELSRYLPGTGEEDTARLERDGAGS